jgi:ribonucleoside-diphosphate reductase alpha chain
VDKFSHARFEPSGMTKNPEVRFAKSIVDYIFRWMATKFLSEAAQFRAGVNIPEALASPVTATPKTVVAETATRTSADTASHSVEYAAIQNQEDAPPCSMCGSIMIRSGACYKCANCGTTSGCA